MCATGLEIFDGYEYRTCTYIEVSCTVDYFANLTKVVSLVY